MARYLGAIYHIHVSRIPETNLYLSAFSVTLLAGGEFDEHPIQYLTKRGTTDFLEFSSEQAAFDAAEIRAQSKIEDLQARTIGKDGCYADEFGNPRIF